ncbi:hypothetical protein ARMSODRAFT_970340 [Armillaria solidipes]|uniref:Uncharacterized protein n=1 Tax=Armillaria solidipes TaxID=1076256 RepID=A0A2H3C950_9AGAR|nr:hypothetical protein ARMSODRAFT_970340 [Armillaria solidipes]
MSSPTLASLAVHRPGDNRRLLVPVRIDCEGNWEGLQRHVNKGYDIRMQVVYLLDPPRPENEPATIENETKRVSKALIDQRRGRAAGCAGQHAGVIVIVFAMATGRGLTSRNLERQSRKTCLATKVPAVGTLEDVAKYIGTKHVDGCYTKISPGLHTRSLGSCPARL